MQNEPLVKAAVVEPLAAMAARHRMSRAAMPEELVFTGRTAVLESPTDTGDLFLRVTSLRTRSDGCCRLLPDPVVPLAGSGGAK